jgi:long-chain acyl-CoA synthetase
MPVNIAQLFSRHRVSPDRVLYRHFTGDKWEDVTVDEIARCIGRWQAAFRREGLAPGERIALCARNGVNWVAIDQAALGLGLVVVPLYVDDNPDNVAWCVDHAKARLLIVENSPEPWSVDNGLLTPTLKLKRPLLLQKLAREINAAYAEAST